MSNTDFYAQGFGIRGRGEVVVEGRRFDVSNHVAELAARINRDLR